MANLKKNLLHLILYPNDTLLKFSKKFLYIDNNIIFFCINLVNLMFRYYALGISAIQVGYLNRVIILNFSALYSSFSNMPFCGFIILINPEIIYKSFNASIYIEGCLSFHNIFFKVIRSFSIIVKYLNIFGFLKILKVKNSIFVSCLFHEIDHINGILFIYKISRLKKYFIDKKCFKMQKNIQIYNNYNFF